MAEQGQAWVARMQRVLPTLHRRRQPALKRIRARLQQRIRQRAPKDRGELARSVRVAVDRRGIVASIPGRYLAIEEGGTPRPKRGRWPAVPMRPTGVTGPRQDPVRMFVLTASSGKRYLVARNGRALDFRWRLVRSVRLRAQRFVGKASTTEIPRTVEELQRNFAAEVADGR